LRANKVCRYWRDKQSIFITHFIHPGDGTKESIIVSLQQPARVSVCCPLNHAVIAYTDQQDMG
jgi:hypothetical protein